MSQDQPEKVKKSNPLRTVLSIIVTIALVVAVVFCLRTFVFQAYTIPSGSMEDTIVPDDMVFSEKVSYYFGSPKQGDIITFDDPLDPSRILIKRVIAVGGQTVNISNGKVSVDGVELEESYTEGKVTEPFASTATGVSIDYPYIVPQDELWVMGDNRTNSEDSRYFGSIKTSTVTGKAAIIYWPLDHIKLLS